MGYKYTAFDVSSSKVANEILNTPTMALIRRYIKRRDESSLKFFDAIKQEINKVDDEEYLINPYLYDMEGRNLNYVANQVFVIASKLKPLGFEFKIENVVRDLDRLFGEYSEEVDKMNIDSAIQPISKDITYFFVSEILKMKIMPTLENIASKKLPIAID